MGGSGSRNKSSTQLQTFTAKLNVKGSFSAGGDVLCNKIINVRPDADFKLIKISMRYKFKTNFTHLKSIFNVAFCEQLTDIKETEYSIVHVEELNNGNAGIILKFDNPNCNIDDLYLRIREKCSLDCWFLYYIDTDIKVDATGKIWSLAIRTVHHFEKEDIVLPGIHDKYPEKMKELLMQLDKKITVNMNSESITRKDGFEYVSFTIRSKNIKHSELDAHLKTKCQKWEFEDAVLVEKESASWLPVREKRKIRRDVQDVLYGFKDRDVICDINFSHTD